MVGTTAGEIWRQMRPSLTAGGWLAATAVPALWLTRGMPDPVRLLAAALAGGLAYLIAMWHYDPVVIKRMAGWLGLRRKVAA